MEVSLEILILELHEGGPSVFVLFLGGAILVEVIGAYHFFMGVAKHYIHLNEICVEETLIT